MFRRVIWVMILAVVFAMLLPIRPAARMPELQQIDAQAITSQADGETASLSRILHLSGRENLYTLSVYCYGLPADRLALMQGSQEPSRVTVYFDGIRFLGVTTTYDGAGEYFDLHGNSAAQLDGLSDQQYFKLQAQARAKLDEKNEQVSHNLHNFIVNVNS